MGDLLQPSHLMFIAIILLVLFGAKRLPELGKGLGEGLKGFKEGIKGVTEPTVSVPPTANAQQQNAVPAPPPTVSVEPK